MSEMSGKTVGEPWINWMRTSVDKPETIAPVAVNKAMALFPGARENWS